MPRAGHGGDSRSVRQRLLTSENRRWWTLGAVGVGLFMLMLDNTVVNVALPSIERDLGARLSELEWIVAGYALTFAALLLTGGKLADVFGRRLAFLGGLAVFSASSLACALAPNAQFLVGSRIVQGVGAALMNPASLSIIATTFPPRERGAAIGIWAGISATALAIGPFLGGLLTEHVGWSAIFYVNVPIGAFAIVAGMFLIDESKDRSEGRSVDAPGLIASAVGLFSFTYALIEGNNHGWGSTRIVGAFAVAACALAGFVALEARGRRPMLDLALFRSRTFAGACAVVMLLGMSLFGVLFYISLYMQNVLGYSPLRAGAAFLPMTLLIIVVAPLAGRRSDRVGSRGLLTLGTALVAAQLFYFSRLDVDATYWQLVPGMLVGGIGIASVMSPGTAAALSGIPADKAGVGSGVVNMARQLGGSIGIALLGAVVAHAAAGRRTPEAYVHGLSTALVVAGAIALVGAVVAATLVRSHAETESAPAPGSARPEPA
jgi:EmrB/QacA subfamily drug resistance transporter